MNDVARLAKEAYDLLAIIRRGSPSEDVRRQAGQAMAQVSKLSTYVGEPIAILPIQGAVTPHKNGVTP